MNNVSMNGPIVSASVAGGFVAGRTNRAHDRLGIDSLASAAASPEESLVIDDRCDLSPAQMVETKLTRVLGGSTLPVSHLQMRGLLRQR